MSRFPGRNSFSLSRGSGRPYSAGPAKNTFMNIQRGGGSNWIENKRLMLRKILKRSHRARIFLALEYSTTRYISRTLLCKRRLIAGFILRLDKGNLSPVNRYFFNSDREIHKENFRGWEKKKTRARRNEHRRGYKLARELTRGYVSRIPDQKLRANISFVYF